MFKLWWTEPNMADYGLKSKGDFHNPELGMCKTMKKSLQKFTQLKMHFS